MQDCTLNGPSHELRRKRRWTGGRGRTCRLAVGCFAALATLHVGAGIRGDAPLAPVALVVGNTNYESFAADPSGKNDADAVAQALLRLGFAVTERFDLDRSELVDELVRFHERSRGRSAALFYYSGHALNGRSLDKGRVLDVLMPVDAPEQQHPIAYGIDIEYILAGMQGAVNLLLLDAAMRARPRIRRMNTLIAYAGEVPRIVVGEDGVPTGAFTAALLTGMAPGVDVVDMVREAIRSELVGPADSRPWMESSLRRPYRLPYPLELLADRLDARLLALVERFESHGLQAATASGVANGVTVEDDAVAVRIIAESEGDVEALRQAVEVAGGSVQSVFESNVFASLPVASLGAFARFMPLYRMDLQEPVASPMAVPGEEQGAVDPSENGQ